LRTIDRFVNDSGGAIRRAYRAVTREPPAKLVDLASDVVVGASDDRVDVRAEPLSIGPEALVDECERPTTDHEHEPGMGVGPEDLLDQTDRSLRLLEARCRLAMTMGGRCEQAIDRIDQHRWIGREILGRNRDQLRTLWLAADADDRNVERLCVTGEAHDGVRAGCVAQRGCDRPVQPLARLLIPGGRCLALGEVRP
jgi:hypothetical protein